MLCPFPFSVLAHPLTICSHSVLLSLSVFLTVYAAWRSLSLGVLYKISFWPAEHVCWVYFQADPRLLDDIVGLRPDQDKHQFQIDILPVSVLPLVFFRLAYSARPSSGTSAGYRPVYFSWHSLGMRICARHFLSGRHNHFSASNFSLDILPVWVLPRQCFRLALPSARYLTQW